MKSCRLFGVHRQTIYQQRDRLQAKGVQLEPIKEIVLTIRRKMPRLGGRKLYKLIKPRLEELNIKMGRDGLFSYLRSQNLLVKPRKNYTKTTFSHHHLRKHPNLYTDLELTRREQAFVSDITYVESDEGVHYLSLVTDAHTRKIMGHHLSKDMKAESVVKALKQAVKNRLDKRSLIHHSDRGSQYCSALYQQTLDKNNITPSTTDGYDCYQNALAERVNGILKQEFLVYQCKTFDEMKVLIDESIDTYNCYRPHLSLGMKTPNQVHKKTSCNEQLAF